MGSTVPDFSALAECFAVRESVIENLFEEYEVEVEAFGIEINFYEYLVEEFAQAAYMIEALQNNGDAVDCLEAYDAAYSLFEDENG
jgi:hypothetical protein